MLDYYDMTIIPIKYLRFQVCANVEKQLVFNIWHSLEYIWKIILTGKKMTRLLVMELLSKHSHKNICSQHMTTGAILKQYTRLLYYYAYMYLGTTELIRFFYQSKTTRMRVIMEQVICDIFKFTFRWVINTRICFAVGFCCRGPPNRDRDWSGRQVWWHDRPKHISVCQGINAGMSWRTLQT